MNKHTTGFIVYSLMLTTVAATEPLQSVNKTFNTSLQTQDRTKTVDAANFFYHEAGTAKATVHLLLQDLPSSKKESSIYPGPILTF